MKQPLAKQPSVPYIQQEFCVVEMEASLKPIFDALQELCDHGFGRVEAIIQDGKIQVVKVTKNYKR